MGYQDRDWYKDEMRKRNNATTKHRIIKKGNLMKAALLISVSLNVFLGYSFLNLLGYL